MLSSGVAIGSGWQVYVAYINIGCYYVVGLPLGIVMGWVFNTGVVVTSSTIYAISVDVTCNLGVFFCV